MKSLRDEIAHNADLVRPKRGDEAARARHRDLMLGRYSEGLTLQEIGDYFGITKERVRVLLLDASNRAHGLKLATTAFSRLTRAIAKSGALTANQLQQECQAILGAGGTIVGALTYADRMLKQPLGLEILTHRMGVDLVAGKGTENWIGDASRMAHQQVYQHGAVTVAAVTRHVNSLREIRLSNSETLGVLQELQGFDWLDESQQWFWFGPTHSRLAEWAVALLHIAERPMSAQEIHDALMRRQSMRFELALGQLPSVAAIDQHLSTADSLSRRQGKFRLIGEGGLPADASRMASLLIERITNLGGVASRRELAIVADEAGLSIASFDVTLMASPLLERLEVGVYAVRGRAFDSQALKRARASMTV